jgi:hypothetical protein
MKANAVPKRRTTQAQRQRAAPAPQQQIMEEVTTTSRGMLEAAEALVQAVQQVCQLPR